MTQLFRSGRLGLLPLLVFAAFPAPTVRAQPAPDPADRTAPAYTPLARFVDRLPELMDFALPTLGPEGLFRLYTHPHFGDFLHNDYIRIPVGVRAKIRPKLEISGELQSYFTHGLRHSAGNGLSGLLLGIKREQMIDDRKDAGWSTGVNFSTPLSRPPSELSDGYRHILPYVAATYPLVARWKLEGYSTLGADLLKHTALPSNFGRNQLHTDAMSLAVGAARDWRLFQLSLTATYATTAVLSNETQDVFGLRPTILIPFRPVATSRMRCLLTFGGRAIWGPDGRELGVSTSLRVEFDLKTK